MGSQYLTNALLLCLVILAVSPYLVAIVERLQRKKKAKMRQSRKTRTKTQFRRLGPRARR